VNQNRVADLGAQGFQCQEGKIPCDQLALDEVNRERSEAEISEEGEISKTLSIYEVEHILCVDYVTDCPITDIKVSNNETYTADIVNSGYEAIYTGDIGDGGETTIFISKQSKSLPVAGGRLSPFEPCLNPSEFPLSPSNYFDDELQMRASECSESTFHESSRDMRFEKLDLPIKQKDLEEENGITRILADRYEKGPSSARIIRQIRKHNVYNPYVRKTINWKLSCETGDDAIMPRRDAYENILTRLLESQVITIGMMSETPTLVALFIFLAALTIAVTVLIIKCC